MQFKTAILIPAFTLLQVGGVLAGAYDCKVDAIQTHKNGRSVYRWQSFGECGGKEPVTVRVGDSGDKTVQGLFDSSCNFTIIKGKVPGGWSVEGSVHRRST